MNNAPKTATKSKRAAVGGRKKGQGSKWCAKDKRLAIYLRDNMACAYCSRTVVAGSDATLDHILACELGGTNAPANLVTCCLSCNSSKRDLSVRNWFAVLRSNGVDTDLTGRKVRQATKRNLKKHRVAAKKHIAVHGYKGACAVINAEYINDFNKND